jgi:hypothetical protein
MWLYRIYAWIIMPRAGHRESRMIFVREAQKLARKEFLRWFRLTLELTATPAPVRGARPGIPTLYLMGEEDHMFLPAARRIAARHTPRRAAVIERCGHVCNIEPDEYDRGEKPLIRAMGERCRRRCGRRTARRVAFVSAARRPLVRRPVRRRHTPRALGVAGCRLRLQVRCGRRTAGGSHSCAGPERRSAAGAAGAVGIGHPPGDLPDPAVPAARRRRCAGRDTTLNQRHVPGLYSATLPDGSVLAIMAVDVADVDDIDSPPARVLWRNVARRRIRSPA